MEDPNITSSAWLLPKLIEQRREIEDLKKALIDCQEYSRSADRKAHEYNEALGMFLAKDGLEWMPGAGLSIKRG